MSMSGANTCAPAVVLCALHLIMPIAGIAITLHVIHELQDVVHMDVHHSVVESSGV